MKDLKSLQALIALMDDPDEQVYAHVRDRLLEIGPDAVQLLESSWEEKDYGLLFQSRIETLIHEIQFEECKRQLVSWYHSSTKDLLKGAIIIAKYQYPGLDEKHVYEFIERVRIYSHYHSSTLRSVRIFREFKELQFATQFIHQYGH